MELELGPIIENLAGNGVLGAVLAWFMVQHSHLVKALMTLVDENTKAAQKTKDALENIKNVMEKCEK